MTTCQIRFRIGPNNIFGTFLAVFSLGLLLASQAQAGRFIALSEAETFAPGVGEVIQVGNWQREKVGEDEMTIINMQLGIEFGLASRFHVGMALPAYSDLRGANFRNTKFGGMSMWGLYNFFLPTSQNLGISGGMILTEGDESLAMEANLVLEKSWEPVVVVMNIIAGHGWMRKVDVEDHGFLIGRLGASRDLGRSFSLAIETEWCFHHRGGIRYHSDEMKMGSSLVWNAGPLWVLGGLLFDAHSKSDLQGPALQLQAGVPF